ncbi:MAG: Holliday junction resolvase RuvX [Candidatus Neomarinimicrobiota bacterium]|jgi:putative Holliday junction resolvase|nr:Holliday junction resolvase RuvX [Candidatus Neomarinimicrobiota bacterium]
MKKRILGIDYGNRRIGLAISDPLNIFAKPFHTIDKNKKPKFLNEIYEVIKNMNIEKVVVGLPLNMKGIDSEQTKIVRKFVQILKKKINIPIIFQDERLSSKSAKEYLIMQNISPSKNKKSVDSVAASIILQEFLDNS